MCSCLGLLWSCAPLYVTGKSRLCTLVVVFKDSLWHSLFMTTGRDRLYLLQPCSQAVLIPSLSSFPGYSVGSLGMRIYPLATPVTPLICRVEMLDLNQLKQSSKLGEQFKLSRRLAITLFAFIIISPPSSHVTLCQR